MTTDKIGAEAIADELLRERKRQVVVEGFSRLTDDEYTAGELSRAALNYVAAATITTALGGSRFAADASPPLNGMGYASGWPWSAAWWKPGLVRRMLVKAGALIIAEIERLDRAAAREQGDPAEQAAPAEAPAAPGAQS